MMNEVSTLNPCNRPDRGMSADAGATALFILVIIGVIAAAVWSMWGKKDAGTELTIFQCQRHRGRVRWRLQVFCCYERWLKRLSGESVCLAPGICRKASMSG